MSQISYHHTFKRHIECRILTGAGMLHLHLILFTIHISIRLDDDQESSLRLAL